MTEYEKIMVEHAKSERKRETINMLVAGFVGFCSVFTGFCSILVACYGNRTAALQAMIAKNAEAPIFEIIYTPPYENDSEESSIEVSILEGKYSNLDSEIITFLSFNFMGTGSGGYWTSLKKVDLPAILYYTGGNKPGPLYGVVDTWTGTSPSKLDRFLQACITHYTETNSTRNTDQPTPIQFTIVTYLKLTYLNLLGNMETVYYCIDPDSHNLIVQIVSEQGKEKFEKYDDMIKNGLYVDINKDWPSEKADVFKRIDMIT